MIVSSFKLTMITGSETSCMRMKAGLLNTIVRVGGYPPFQRKKLKRWMSWHTCFHFAGVRDIQGTTPLGWGKWRKSHPTTRKAILTYATGDDLNLFYNRHGYTALIVVGEPWNDRDSRKNGSGKAAHMAKGSSLLFQIQKERTVREALWEIRLMYWIV